MLFVLDIYLVKYLEMGTGRIEGHSKAENYSLIVSGLYNVPKYLSILMIILIYTVNSYLHFKNLNSRIKAGEHLIPAKRL
jgi:hypothetical protein